MKSSSCIAAISMRLTILILLVNSINLSQQSSFSPRHYFYQFRNINTVFSSDGVFNLDKVNFTSLEAGFVWPTSSPTRKTMVFASGFWIGTKLIMPGNVRELRFSGSMYEGQFTAGIIPIPGQVPPLSVCNDTLWQGYLINLTDSSLIDGGVRTKSAAGRLYAFRYSPWAAWPVFAGASYVEVNNIPGYQPGWNSDRPGIGGSSARPDEMLLIIMMDYTDCSDSIRTPSFGVPGGTKPIGIELHQLIFMFDHPSLNNAYFIKWKIINKSARTMDSTYIGLYSDLDVGSAFDDAKGCDSVRGVGFCYNGIESDPYYGTPPPAVGFKFLQTPLVRTFNNLDTAKTFCDSLVGFKQTGFTSHADINKSGDSCRLEPSYAINAYQHMKGLDGCGNPFINYVTGKATKFKYSGDACNRAGWFDSVAHDTRSLICSGPFTMQPLDTQIVVSSFFVARGTSNLNSVCRVLQYSDDISVLYPYIVCGYPIIGLSDPGSSFPAEFRLHQNYPNPFNPVTKIRFAVAADVNHETSNINLLVFDILGRQVSILINQNLMSGVYEVDFDGTDYPSGIYFCRLSSDNYSQTIKMILLK